MHQLRKPRSPGVRGLRRRERLAVLLVALATCSAAFAGDDVVFASSFEDGETSGGGWQVLQWPQPANYQSKCQLIRVYGVVPGDQFTFTTCVPPGFSGAAGTGDPLILSVFDTSGANYNVTNDDCDLNLVPQLAGWNCRSTIEPTFSRMPCAPENAEGLTVLPGATYLDVTICPLDPGDGTSTGTSAFHILWKGTSTPNPG